MLLTHVKPKAREVVNSLFTAIIPFCHVLGTSTIEVLLSIKCELPRFIVHSLQ